MFMIKNYSEFINEGLRDMMKPKTEEEILKGLSELNPLEKFFVIYKNNLDKKYLPTDQELKNHLKNYSRGKLNNLLLKIVSSDNVNLVRKILEMDLNVNINHFFDGYTSGDKFTLLHIAIDNESTDMVKLLLKHGADPLTKDANNRTALELAEFYNFSDMVNMMYGVLDKKYENMKYLKTYKQINEGLRDMMKPQSDENILKELKELSDSDRIIKILTNSLPFEFLPDNLTVNGDLDCFNNQLTKLPDNLTVNGDLDCSYNQIIKFPDNLTVNGKLDCSYNQITKLPDNLIVRGSLNCSNNKITEFPDNLTVNNHLICSYNQITKLPDNLTINGNLDCLNNLLERLPRGMIVNGYLECSDNKITELPDDLIVNGSLYTDNYNLDIPKGVNNVYYKKKGEN